MEKKEKRSYNQKVNDKQRILRYLFAVKSCTRKQLCSALKLSKPTINKKVNELADKRLVSIRQIVSTEKGRKATLISLKQDAFFSVGIEIQMHVVRFVLLNFQGKPIFRRQHRIEYSNSINYFQTISNIVDSIIYEGNIASHQVLGLCFVFPGTINYQNSSVTLALSLREQNLSLDQYRKYFHHPLFLIQDSKNVCIQAIMHHPEMQDFVFLYISQLVGGSVVHNGRLLLTKNNRCGEFGHISLVPHGRRCYCGNEGCASAYLSTDVLAQTFNGSHDSFFKELQDGNSSCLSAWYRYLDYLVMLLHNLNMAYDMPIVLGGDLAPYIEPYMEYVNARVSALNFFHDSSPVLLGINDVTDDVLGAGLFCFWHFFDVYR